MTGKGDGHGCEGGEKVFHKEFSSNLDTAWSGAKAKQLGSMDRLNGAGSLLAANDADLASLAKIQRPNICKAYVVAEFLDAKDRAGMTARYITEYRLVLKRFQDVFRCNIAGITTSELQAYIDRLKLALRSKNTIAKRSSLSSLTPAAEAISTGTSSSELTKQRPARGA